MLLWTYEILCEFKLHALQQQPCRLQPDLVKVFTGAAVARACIDRAPGGLMCRTQRVCTQAENLHHFPFNPDHSGPESG